MVKRAFLQLLCVAGLMCDTAMALAPKILVLGGTGFIGSMVSKIAIDSGYQVLWLYDTKRVKCRGA